MEFDARAKFRRFERMLFLRSRAIRSTGAAGAVAGLLALLDELARDPAVAASSFASETALKLGVELQRVASAIEAGAAHTACDVYAAVVARIPSVHASLWESLPAEVRGHDKTDTAALAEAAARASAILGA